MQKCKEVVAEGRRVSSGNLLSIVGLYTQYDGKSLERFVGTANYKQYIQS